MKWWFLAAVLLAPTLAYSQTILSGNEQIQYELTTPRTESLSDSIVNFDARTPSIGEAEMFGLIACQGTLSQGSTDYPLQCQMLNGYPGNQYTSPGPYGLLFSSIIYGHLTDTKVLQAYITYKGNFESHADNYGGGILFQLTQGGWQLVNWYPSLLMDDCLQLNPDGQAALLCPGSYSGMGQTDTSLSTISIPKSYRTDSAYPSVLVLSAQDDRQGEDTNYDCQLPKSSAQAILLSVSNLQKADKPGYIGMAQISFVDPSTVATYCAKKDFVDAPVTTENVRFSWDGHKLTTTPNIEFAKTDG